TGTRPTCHTTHGREAAASLTADFGAARIIAGRQRTNLRLDSEGEGYSDGEDRGPRGGIRESPPRTTSTRNHSTESGAIQERGSENPLGETKLECSWRSKPSAAAGVTSRWRGFCRPGRGSRRSPYRARPTFRLD